MLAIETEVHIRCHLDCSRHQWAYSGWTWVIDGEKNAVNQGLQTDQAGKVVENVSRYDFVPDGCSLPAISKDNMASRRAVCNAFRWAATEMEPSGKEIYRHHWVDALADLTRGDEDNPQETGSVMDNDAIKRVEKWLASLNLDRP
jgi:hypothetical protein